MDHTSLAATRTSITMECTGALDVHFEKLLQFKIIMEIDRLPRLRSVDDWLQIPVSCDHFVTDILSSTLMAFQMRFMIPTTSVIVGDESL